LDDIAVLVFKKVPELIGQGATAFHLYGLCNDLPEHRVGIAGPLRELGATCQGQQRVRSDLLMPGTRHQARYGIDERGDCKVCHGCFPKRRGGDQRGTSAEEQHPDEQLHRLRLVWDGIPVVEIAACGLIE
jgi:hypothetical protein